MKILAKLSAAVLVIAVILGFSILANLPRPGSRTRAYLGVVNMLRNIDDAKQQYAIEHQTPPETVLTREELLPYIPNRLWNSHVIYKINALREKPEAVLPAPFDNLPGGTIIRLHTNDSSYEIIIPGH